MRTCSKCKTEYKATRKYFPPNGKYLRSECRECFRKTVAKSITKSAHNGIYYLYYLPEEHYIGITNQVPRRMVQHKYQGKITTDYEIIMEHTNPLYLSLMEALMHYIGYRGSHYDNILTGQNKRKNEK